MTDRNVPASIHPERSRDSGGRRRPTSGRRCCRSGRSVAPFGIASASQFRPAFPPDLTSDEYASDFEEVRTLGALNSDIRSRDQTQIAYFWADGPGTVTPPGHWNRIAQSVARSTGLSLHENARLFALLNVALGDAAIVCWDMKFTCNLWRPITAIQEADTDGNDRTTRDPSWRPLLDTPPFPSCTSGHSTFSGAAAAGARVILWPRCDAFYRHLRRRESRVAPTTVFRRRPRKQDGAAFMAAFISSSTIGPGSRVAVPWADTSSNTTCSQFRRRRMTDWRLERQIAFHLMTAG